MWHKYEKHKNKLNSRCVGASRDACEFERETSLPTIQNVSCLHNLWNKTDSSRKEETPRSAGRELCEPRGFRYSNETARNRGYFIRRGTPISRVTTVLPDRRRRHASSNGVVVVVAVVVHLLSYLWTFVFFFSLQIHFSSYFFADDLRELIFMDEKKCMFHTERTFFFHKTSINPWSEYWKSIDRRIVTNKQKSHTQERVSAAIEVLEFLKTNTNTEFHEISRLELLFCIFFLTYRHTKIILRWNNRANVSEILRFTCEMW